MERAGKSIIIAIGNEKGGVGKTTATFAIGSLLAKAGYGVLMVDLDRQTDLTLAIQLKKKPKATIYEVLMQEKSLAVEEINERLTLLPGSGAIGGFEERIRKRSPKHFHHENLKRALAPAVEAKSCDFILLDCPPVLDTLIVDNAFTCSDFVLIPTDLHPFGLVGVQAVLDAVELYKEAYNPALEVLGVFFNRVRSRTNIHRDLAKSARQRFGKLVLKQEIRENIALQESSTLGIELAQYDQKKAEASVVKHAKPSLGYEDYTKLVWEMMSRLELYTKR